MTSKPMCVCSGMAKARPKSTHALPAPTANGAMQRPAVTTESMRSASQWYEPAERDDGSCATRSVGRRAGAWSGGYAAVSAGRAAMAERKSQASGIGGGRGGRMRTSSQEASKRRLRGPTTRRTHVEWPRHQRKPSDRRASESVRREDAGGLHDWVVGTGRAAMLL